MEIIVALIGLVIAVLVWLFPPEPLRHLFGIKGSTLSEANKDKKPARLLVKAFRHSLEDLTIVDDDQYFKMRAPAMMKQKPFPRIMKRSHKDKLFAWIDSLDDELLLVTLAIREYWNGKDWREGFPRKALVIRSHPQGAGRGVPDLEKALIDSGVLAPHEDPYLFHYGGNLQMALDYIDLTDWTELKASVAEGRLSLLPTRKAKR